MRDTCKSIVSCLSLILLAYAQAVTKSGERSLFRPGCVASKRNLLTLAQNALVGDGSIYDSVCVVLENSWPTDCIYPEAAQVKQARGYIDQLRKYDKDAAQELMAFTRIFLDGFGENFEVSPRIAQSKNLRVLEKSIHLRLVAA
jgi:hypothetical protein